MTRASVLFASALVCAQPLLAEPTSPPTAAPVSDPERAGQELAARLRSMPPAESSAFRGVLKITPRRGETRAIPITGVIMLRDTNSLSASWETVYRTVAAEQVPQETLCIRSRAGRPNEYLYARGQTAGKLPDDSWRVAGEKLEVPLAGTDFWLCDLGLEFLHWPTQRVVKAQLFRSRSCRILESINPRPSASGYARVLSWIDIEENGLIQAEAYDKANKLMKEFSLGSFTKVNGLWQLRDMKMRNARTGSRTWLEFDLGK